jgi:hypothetical protein
MSIITVYLELRFASIHTRMPQTARYTGSAHIRPSVRCMFTEANVCHIAFANKRLYDGREKML